MTSKSSPNTGAGKGVGSPLVTHLECSETGEHHPPGVLHGLSRAGAPLIVRYDLKALGRAVTKDAVAQRPPDMWRYREFLPLGPEIEPVSLGEPMPLPASVFGLDFDVIGLFPPVDGKSSQERHISGKQMSL